MALITVVTLSAAQAGVGTPGVGLGSGSNGNPGILPPNSNAYGASYGVWSARWWQWAFSFRADAHPLLENAGCDAGQSGQVWFLGGSFTGAPVTRSCTIPAGMPIFFPIVNVECSTVEPPPFFGSDEAELRACAKVFMDPVVVSDLVVTVDGRPLYNLGDYRVQSPLYKFSAPDGGLFGGPVTDAKSISDGFWLLLAPLSAGRHTIHFEYLAFGQNVTYILTVLPGGRGRGHVEASDSGRVEHSTWGLVKEIYRK